MPKFKVVIGWSVSAEITVEAETKEEAEKKAITNTNFIKSPPTYVIGSLFTDEITEVEA